MPAGGTHLETNAGTRMKFSCFEVGISTRGIVGGVRFDALLAALLLAVGGGLLGSLGRGLLGWCFSHDWIVVVVESC